MAADRKLQARIGAPRSRTARIFQMQGILFYWHSLADPKAEPQGLRSIDIFRCRGG